jgi:hypothetical protein
MKLKKELDKLKTLFGSDKTNEFKKQVEFLKDTFTSDAEIKEIDAFINAMVKESMEERDKAFNEIKLRAELFLNKDIIPFSYIAKNYFKKSKSWLYQRLNGNSVNGKPATFTPDEIRIFNSALQDISKKIGSIIIA